MKCDAFGVQAATVVHARILTDAVDAGFLGRAIGVGSAFRMWNDVGVTVDIRVANVSGGTFANVTMIFNSALGGVRAWVSQTRIDAVVMQTSCIQRTLRIGSAQSFG